MSVLSDELENDPLGRGYASMVTNEEVAADLNSVYRTRNRASVTGDEIFAATDSVEFNGLTSEAKSMWLAFCGRSYLDPFSPANVAFVQWVFGSGSDTVTNLMDLRVADISRAQELGIQVSAGDVQAVRS